MTSLGPIEFVIIGVILVFVVAGAVIVAAAARWLWINRPGQIDRSVP